jgi:enoyl-[acyl-carrier protein] reductase II
VGILRTPVNDLVGIKYPIFQGGMAWVATGELAAAVSKAGGLGIIGAGNAPADVVREEIKKVKSLTSNPFGVNVYYMSPFVDEVIQVVAEEKVPVVTTGAGNPGKHLPLLKENGCLVFPVVASVALAKRLERQGVDGLIAEGTECGGHVGELTTMVLVPQIVDAVDIPVIAAGGICDGRGVAAALSLGAVGVQVGTRFIACDECQCSPEYKKAILRAKERDAVVSGPKGHKVRSLKNKLTKQYEKLARNNASFEEMEKLGEGALRRAVKEGDIDNGSVMAGQVAAMITEIKPAKDIIEEMMQEAEEVISRLNSFK